MGGLISLNLIGHWASRSPHTPFIYLSPISPKMLPWGRGIPKQKNYHRLLPGLGYSPPPPWPSILCGSAARPFLAGMFPAPPVRPLIPFIQINTLCGAPFLPVARFPSPDRQEIPLATSSEAVRYRVIKPEARGGNLWRRNRHCMPILQCPSPDNLLPCASHCTAITLP